MIIAFLNQKGGAGKTTLATNVAHALARGRKRVLLIDADGQESAVDLFKFRDPESPPPFEVLALATDTIHRRVADLRYDHIVIDGTPRVEAITRSAMMAADLVAIPITQSPFDLWSVDATIRLVTEAKKVKPGLKACLVINRRRQNRRRDQILADLADYPEVPVLKEGVGDRIVFQNAADRGQTVLEANNALAKAEILALAKALLKEGKP